MVEPYFAFPNGVYVLTLTIVDYGLLSKFLAKSDCLVSRYCHRDIHPVPSSSRSRWAISLCRLLLVTSVTGYTFRSDGRYFILAERHKSKDTLGLYDAFESYRLARACFRSFLPLHSASDRWNV